MSPIRAVLIAGPTASGKSAAALALAGQVNGIVVNTDSMQVYRDLRILTARPTAEDEARAPHRLYGVVPASENYSVGRWLGDAACVLAEAASAGHLPIFVGGTGLYFKALLDGLSPVPEIPEATRRHWREQANALSGAELHAELAERDPDMAERLRPSDPQRLVRALEVIDATGRSLGDWQSEEGEAVLAPDETLRLVLSPERDGLYARIDARFETMLTEGALEEVQALARQQLGSDLPAMRAHGVKPLLAHLRGEISLEEAGERVKTDIRRYAKRQRTWARRFMADWRWFDDADALLHHARDKLC